MSRAYTYLARELAKSYALIAAAMLVLFDLLAFLTESQDIGDARYSAIDALVVVAYGTPALLVDLSPFIGLLATLNAYDRLNATSELIAMRAAGISGPRFGAVACAVAAIFMCFVAIVEQAARPLRLDASLLRMHETAPAGNLLRGSGFWIRTGDTFVNVASLDDADTPSGIRMFSFAPNSQLQSYLRASRAEVVDARNWLLHDVWTKRFDDDGTPDVPSSTQDMPWRATWDRATRLYDLPVASFTIKELAIRIAHRANESAGAQGEQIELWRRLTLPLAALAYALLAAPFALMSNLRGGRSGRLALGAAMAFLVYIGQQVVSNAGILAGLSVATTSIVPPLLVFLVALWALRRFG